MQFEFPHFVGFSFLNILFQHTLCLVAGDVVLSNDLCTICLALVSRVVWFAHAYTLLDPPWTWRAILFPTVVLGYAVLPSLAWLYHRSIRLQENMHSYAIWFVMK